MLRKIITQRNVIYYIMAVHLLLRIIIAISTCLGIDEVYYVNYARYPDWSFFDHPPMISWLMWLTTAGMHFTSVFFIRLGALIIGTANVYLVYDIGVELKDRKTGIIAALLTCASIYSTIIAGTFILPDTPQSLFWLLALRVFLKYIKADCNRCLWWFGVFAGLAMLSKYHGVFLWFGAFLFILRYRWHRLLSFQFWGAALLSTLIFSPVIIWNYLNKFSSFSFHEGRVGNGSWLPDLKNFLPELLGQFFYNNPVVVVLIIVSIVYFIRNRSWFVNKEINFLLLTSVPLSILVLLMSMYNKTLPHWSGPAYYGFIICAAIYTSSYLLNVKPALANRYVLGANILILFLLALALTQVYTGFIPMPESNKTTSLGSKDPTADLYGWKKAGDAIDQQLSIWVKEGSLHSDFSLVTHKWFPASHIDYYYALPHNKKVYVYGDIKAQHIYGKINSLYGEPELGSDMVYITTSLHYREPDTQLINDFEKVDERPSILTVNRRGKPLFYIYLWRLKGVKKIMGI